MWDGDLLMIILIVGITCVGKSTLGKLLAEDYGYDYIDFDLEVEKRMGEPISFIKNKCGLFDTDNVFRQRVKHILKDLLSEYKDNLVLSMPPSGLFKQYYDILENYPHVLKIELKDFAKSILDRTCFYDEYTQPIYNVINDSNRDYYFKGIKLDLDYYRQSYKRANLHIHLSGRDIQGSLKIIKESINKWLVKKDKPLIDHNLSK